MTSARGAYELAQCPLCLGLLHRSGQTDGVLAHRAGFVYHDRCLRVFSFAADILQERGIPEGVRALFDVLDQPPTANAPSVPAPPAPAASS